MLSFSEYSNLIIFCSLIRSENKNLLLTSSKYLFLDLLGSLSIFFLSFLPSFILFFIIIFPHVWMYKRKWPLCNRWFYISWSLHFLEKKWKWQEKNFFFKKKQMRWNLKMQKVYRLRLKFCVQIIVDKTLPRLSRKNV